MPGNKIYCIVPHLPLVLAQNPYFYIVFWPEKTTWTPASTCDPHTGIHFFRQLQKIWQNQLLI